MDDEPRIFCAEQINVPVELPEILKDYTKAVIRENPAKGETDPVAVRLRMFQWSRDYFRKKLHEGTKEAAAMLRAGFREVARTFHVQLNLCMSTGAAA
eukprot:CAMPEP_0117581478 /NCGR_PEP_ID=MMETSP0784-20121206/65848_1 /TAXON_ID=39447 /ORGANISM="" /LENGTH=97 /DNA_ID=CAMNT_0005381791 /DNA_START=152 /DNA_END=443 /DNA_ORIENTATION=+